MASDEATINPQCRTWTLPAESESVPRLRRKAETHCQEMQVDSGTIEAMKVAVSEAVTNAVLHAYIGIDRGTVTLSTEVTDQEVLVSVSDAGTGMAPRADSPGLGMGIAVIGHFTKKLDIYPADGGGTVVQMRFARG